VHLVQLHEVGSRFVAGRSPKSLHAIAVPLHADDDSFLRAVRIALPRDD
jgi:hypothetical protein